ncbi:MAG TPA: cupin domain-containing protein [Candidatus Elarobacter sp.]|jgi:mannose-6-phosphate isomerase-like protein (cupin superfamily)|nr:cupin domain-containing protein [Candidatus Elarobacter sp.]
MMQTMRVAVVAAFAFAAGFAASHLSAPARADTPAPAPAVTPHYYPDLANLAPPPGKPMVVASAAGASVAYLVGSLPSHTHPVANEFQYVIAGRGTEQFGDCRVAIKPGTFLVIPHGYGHAGMKLAPGSEPLRVLAIKSPPDTRNGPPAPIICQR